MQHKLTCRYYSRFMVFLCFILDNPLCFWYYSFSFPFHLLLSFFFKRSLHELLEHGIDQQNTISLVIVRAQRDRPLATYFHAKQPAWWRLALGLCSRGHYLQWECVYMYIWEGGWKKNKVCRADFLARSFLRNADFRDVTWDYAELADHW